MKVFHTLTTVLLAISAVHAVLVPNNAQRAREDGAVAALASVEGRDTNSLEKRRGGGGRGGGGGGRSGGSSRGNSGGRPNPGSFGSIGGSGSSGSGSSGGRTSSGGTSSGSRSSGGSSGGSSSGNRGGGSSSSPPRTAPNSNAGGTTPGGSGARPAYGGAGGRYYGGGAAVPYTAGLATRGLSPGLLLLPATALLLLPGLWLWSVYPYHYNQPWRYENQSAEENGAVAARNESKPVICLCQEYNPCGCEENNDPEYITSVIGNGSYPALNKTLVNVVDVNGTSTIVINGTLPNGTTADGPDSRAPSPPGMGKYGIVYLMGLMGAYLVLFI